MRKKKFYQKIYKINDSNNSYMIEVSLEDYDDVYDDWDPSPFKKRDIEMEFNDFILDSSMDIPLKENIEIVLYLPENKKADYKEKSLKEAYKNHFYYILQRMKRQREQLNRKTVVYFALSIFFLLVVYRYLGKTEVLPLKILSEGFFVGGWVFLWEVFTNIFITGREGRHDYKICERLYNSELIFVYKQK